GTGGDGLGTFNVSTAAALVTAAAGVPVAKHGNRAVTSKCGSADVLMALGVNIEAEPEVVEECLREAGIGFLFAPRLHPAMKNVVSVRRELGVRTIFNMLGPLTNPAGARAQLLGVFAPELTEPLARVLRDLGSRRALVVHGNDGMDEITVTDTTRISELRDGRIRTYDFDPLPFIGEYYNLEELRGGAPENNARLIENILTGAPGAARAIVTLNAAAGILVGGDDDDWHAAWSRAEAALDSGRARETLRKLVETTTAG
ncbi:MAG: anthranilate phosphoribosyltransferase, partial [Kiritimatiellia bacterium]